MKKRLFAGLLVAAMLLTAAPVPAFAVEELVSSSSAVEDTSADQETPADPSEAPEESSGESPKESASIERPAETPGEDFEGADPSESPEGDLPEEPSEEATEDTPAVVSYTVTYYDQDEETVLIAETVPQDAYATQIPDTTASGEIISAWLVDGTPMDASEVGSLPLTDDLTCIAWVKPRLGSTEHTAYINGTGNGQFSPTKSMTRAEAVTMLGPLLTTAENGPYSLTFTDVDYSSWYGPYVQLLSSNDIIHGKTSTTFVPNATITRAEFVTILANIFPLKESTTQFSDVTDSHWAYAQISSAAAYGWVTGYTNGTFVPDGTITRAEAVAIINRCLGRSASDSTTLSMVNTGGLRRFCDVFSSDWYYSEVIEASTPHNYHMNGTQEVWDSYTALSSGLNAGMVSIGSYYYHVNQAGQFDTYTAGFQSIDGKTYYVNSSGLIPKLSAGLQELGTDLIYVQSDGSLMTNASYGYLTFGSNGTYTSGNSTLDSLVKAALAKCTTSGASAETRLRQAYVYLRDNYTYLSRSHHARGSTDWTVESATFFLQYGKGNCYCFAATFLYMARQLGFQAYPISGGVGSNNADHAWVMINWSDGNTYLFDVELEYAYHHRYTGSRHNPYLDIYKKTRSQYPFVYYFPS